MGGIKKRIYNVEEAAEYLGRSVGAIREMIYAGKLPVIKDGRRTQLDIHDMDKWIEQNRIRYDS